jgi:ergot alkaloid biosynthesis protein
MRASRSEGSPRVLVTGAAGNTGRRVAARLGEWGLTVRAAVRNGAPPDEARERVRFDWADPSTHEEALAGVDRMYLLAPAFVEDPSTLMVPFIERALARGVRRVVLLSSSALPEGTPGLGRVHRLLRERAPEWAVLQPSWFMQNFVNAHHHHGVTLLRDGLMMTSTGDGHVGFVDADDIAEVAARALADTSSHDTAHVITGPQALSYDDIAAILSRVAGRPIRHVHVSAAEAQRRMMSAGMPERYAGFLVQLDEAIRAGAEARVTDTVSRVTGREPHSFESFAKAHATFWRSRGVQGP